MNPLPLILASALIAFRQLLLSVGPFASAPIAIGLPWLRDLLLAAIAIGSWALYTWPSRRTPLSLLLSGLWLITWWWRWPSASLGEVFLPFFLLTLLDPGTSTTARWLRVETAFVCLWLVVMASRHESWRAGLALGLFDWQFQSSVTESFRRWIEAHQTNLGHGFLFLLAFLPVTLARKRTLRFGAVLSIPLILSMCLLPELQTLGILFAGAFASLLKVSPDRLDLRQNGTA